MDLLGNIVGAVVLLGLLIVLGFIFCALKLNELTEQDLKKINKSQKKRKKSLKKIKK